jgi:hypothetical protein
MYMKDEGSGPMPDLGSGFGVIALITDDKASLSLLNVFAGKPALAQATVDPTPSLPLGWVPPGGPADAHDAPRRF